MVRELLGQVHQYLFGDLGVLHCLALGSSTTADDLSSCAIGLELVVNRAKECFQLTEGESSIQARSHLRLIRRKLGVGAKRTDSLFVADTTAHSYVRQDSIQTLGRDLQQGATILGSGFLVILSGDKFSNLSHCLNNLGVKQINLCQACDVLRQC